MPEPFCAVLLAGGRGSRLGGQDKGRLEIGGESLAARAIGRIRPHAEEILVSANRNPDFYSALGHPVIRDEGWGPLSGLREAMRAASCSLILTLPCDTPFFPEDLAPKLRSALADKEIAVAACNGRIHHAFMLCRKALWADLSAYLDSGGRRIGEWQARHAAVRVDFPDEQAFFNVNTPEELEAARAIFSSGERR